MGCPPARSSERASPGRPLRWMATGALRGVHRTPPTGRLTVTLAGRRSERASDLPVSCSSCGVDRHHLSSSGGILAERQAGTSASSRVGGHRSGAMCEGVRRGRRRESASAIVKFGRWDQASWSSGIYFHPFSATMLGPPRMRRWPHHPGTPAGVVDWGSPVSTSPWASDLLICAGRYRAT